jgi:hypothetical protein
MAAKKLPITKASQQHYRRWQSMIQRCYNLSSRSSKERRRLNTAVDLIWHHENPEGYKNYETWVNCEILKHPELAKDEFRVTLIDATKNFSPDNCKLTTHCAIARSRSTTILTLEMVVEMRKAKRSDPEILLETLVDKYGSTGASISRALRGITWTNVNEKEPPIEKKEFTNERSKTLAYSGKCRNQIKETTL